MEKLTDREHQIVKEIFGLAEAKFYEELQINPRSTFNLLKILSAYNEVLPEYGMSATAESKLYNYILRLSRKYDPHSREEWNNCINRHNTVQNSYINSRSRSISRHNNSVSSTYIRQHNGHNRSIRPTQSQVSDFNQQLDRAPVRSRITTSRRVVVPLDLTHLVEKRHYFAPDPQSNNRFERPAILDQSSIPIDRTMSLEDNSTLTNEPSAILHHDNKENIQPPSNRLSKELEEQLNNTQVTSLKTQLPLKLMNSKTVTQHNLKKQIDNSYLANKTLIKESPKKLTTEEIQVMKMEERADMAYIVNIKTKVFLILKATNLIHDQARNKFKHILEHFKRKHTAKYFKIFLIGAETIKSENVKKRLADQSHRLALKVKTMNILKAVMTLNKACEQQKSYAYLGSNLCINFILSFLLNQMTPDVKEKYAYLSRHKKSEEMQLLLKLYGPLQIRDASVVEEVQGLMEKNTKRLVFDQLLEHSKKLRLVRIYYQHKVKGRIFSQFKQVTAILKEQSKKEKQVVSFDDTRCLKKALSSWQYYMELQRLEHERMKGIDDMYSKNLKKKYFIQWMESVEEKKREYQLLEKKKESLELIFNNQLKQRAMDGLKWYREYKFRKQNNHRKAEHHQSTKLKEKALKVFFECLLNSVKKEVVQTKLRRHTFQCRALFARWRVMAAVFRLTRVLNNSMKIACFQRIGEHAHARVTQSNHMGAAQDHRQRFLFRCLSKVIQDGVSQTNKKFEAIRNRLIVNSKKSLFRLIKEKKARKDTMQQNFMAQHLRIIRLVGQPKDMQQLRKRLYRKHYLGKYFKKLNDYRMHRQAKRMLEVKCQQLNRYRLKRVIEGLRLKCIIQTYNKEIDRLVRKQRILRFRDSLKIKQHLILKKKTEEEIAQIVAKKHEVSIKKEIFRKISQLTQQRKCKQLEAIEYYVTGLMVKYTLLWRSMALAGKQSKQREHTILQSLKQLKKKRVLKKMKQFSQRNIQYKQKSSELWDSRRIRDLSNFFILLSARYNADNELRELQRKCQLLRTNGLFAQLESTLSRTTRVVQEEHWRDHQSDKLRKILAIRSFQRGVMQQIYIQKCEGMAVSHYCQRLMRTCLSVWNRRTTSMTFRHKAQLSKDTTEDYSSK